MSDDSQRWKEKYLASLEQQEQSELLWEGRIDLLRRGLVRCSLAAEGVDKAVDQCMEEVREILRRDEIDQPLGALIPRLEKTVLDSDTRRQQRQQDAVAALQRLIEQLLKLEPGRDLRKMLKSMLKELNKGSVQVYQLPAVLSQLAQLQQQVLSDIGQEAASGPSFLQRLFGAREAQVASVAAEPTAPAIAARAETAAEPVQAAEPAASALPVQPATLVAAQAELEQAPVVSEPAAEQALPEEYALYGSEPGYSAVAPHIAQSLNQLLVGLELPRGHQAQAQLLLNRLNGPLNWYELVPVIDDVAVLVLAANELGQQDFAGYLAQLNKRLELFVGSMQHVQSVHESVSQETLSFSQSLREQVSDMQSSVQEATNLESLKQSLDQRLDALLDSVGSYQQGRVGREEELSERLQGMLQRVAEMEQEANQFREHLEEQRQKSLQDSLTGLPNRAAWVERLELEVERRRRYGGELLLAVLDIDFFKRVNDTFGHQAGDKVLKIVANELNQRLRKTDFIARFGGEEFVLLLPATPLNGGLQLLESLREAVQACPFHFKGEPLTITCSAGLAVFEGDESADEVFERADRALYRAKNNGRNRIEVDDSVVA